jgi:hypothetical protein
LEERLEAVRWQRVFRIAAYAPTQNRAIWGETSHLSVLQRFCPPFRQGIGKKLLHAKLRSQILHTTLLRKTAIDITVFNF